MPANDETRRIAEDSSARRLLNLFFIFNASTQPISTEEIVSDSDLGYGSEQRESDLRKFRRDRQKLAELGVRIVETKPVGASETEESRWQLDRASTFAAAHVVTPDDAQTLAAAIDEYLSHQDTPLARPLSAVRDKALELAPTATAPLGCTDAMPRTGMTSQQVRDAIWQAFEQRRSLPVSYINARGERSRRNIDIYGIITHEGSTYIVGLDDASGSVRTFRTDRIERTWKPRGTYTIPTSFRIRDHVFLPFDFGEGPAVTATFMFPGECTQDAARAITRDRGALEAIDGGRRWTVEVRDIEAAAGFALSHAREGLRPRSPETLVAAWKRSIDKAVRAHGAR